MSLELLEITMDTLYTTTTAIMIETDQPRLDNTKPEKKEEKKRKNRIL